jgi:hypothetical protein
MTDHRRGDDNRTHHGSPGWQPDFADLEADSGAIDQGAYESFEQVFLNSARRLSRRELRRNRPVIRPTRPQLVAAFSMLGLLLIITPLLIIWRLPQPADQSSGLNGNGINIKSASPPAARPHPELEPNNSAAEANWLPYDPAAGRQLYSCTGAVGGEDQNDVFALELPHPAPLSVTCTSFAEEAPPAMAVTLRNADGASQAVLKLGSAADAGTMALATARAGAYYLEVTAGAQTEGYELLVRIGTEHE